MTKDEALRLAFEALEEITRRNQSDHQAEIAEEAITAIKAALEAKGEPVAWVYPEFWQHLENLNCGTAYRLTGIGRQPLYTTPPQRTWVGLTDEDRFELAKAQHGWEDLLISAEAKLKQKNT